MDYKIVQIIPAPNNMCAVYKDETEEFECKIVCLALIEYPDGEREIVPMDIAEGDGIINRTSNGFKCIKFSY